MLPQHSGWGRWCRRCRSSDRCVVIIVVPTVQTSLVRPGRDAIEALRRAWLGASMVHCVPSQWRAVAKAFNPSSAYPTAQTSLLLTAATPVSQVIGSGGVGAGGLAPGGAVPVQGQGLLRDPGAVPYGPDIAGGDGRDAVEGVVEAGAVGAGDLGPGRAVPVQGQRLRAAPEIYVADGPDIVGCRPGDAIEAVVIARRGAADDGPGATVPMQDQGAGEYAAG